LLAGVLAALVGVAVVGGFLNYFYRAERIKRATQEYQAGNDLLQKDRIPEAIDQYRNALSISHNTDHRLALGLALVKAGRFEEASIYLNEVLRDRANSGPANLGMATVAADESRADEAILYYRRAVAGAWPDHPEQNRVESRMQLVRFLAKSARKAQTRAELLLLAADLPKATVLQKQVGRMLIDFGMQKEAADIFTGMIHEGSPDADEYDGLGEAEYLLGDYRAATNAFHHALNIDPADQSAIHRSEVCDEILALDPMQRGLGSRERFQRSQELLHRTLTELLACVGSEAALPASSGEPVAAAREALSRKRAPVSFSDAADANVHLAEKVWAERLSSGKSPIADDPLARIMSDLASR
jgi:tetratricopeptide (TPR) repeat protein